MSASPHPKSLPAPGAPPPEKTIAAELRKRRFSSSDKVRGLLGRDLIPGDESIRASGETLIRYGAV